MSRFAQLPRLGAVLVLLLVAACSSLNMGTAERLRAVDYLNDDLAAMVLAFDLPLGVEPVPAASVLAFNITVPGHGERQLTLVLERGDIGAVAGALPPPAAGRTYYLFGFSEGDRALLREAQAWARSAAAAGGQPRHPSVTLTPRFCAAPGIDPDAEQVSVLVALPHSGAMAPLIDRQNLAALLLASGAGPDLPACRGHSG